MQMRPPATPTCLSSRDDFLIGGTLRRKELVEIQTRITQMLEVYEALGHDVDVDPDDPDNPTSGSGSLVPINNYITP